MTMPNHGYARQKFYEAILAMATSSAAIQKRLVYAGMYLVHLKPEEDLPEELRAEFKAVMHELTKEPAIRDEGTLEATSRKLSDKDATKLAERIVSLHIELYGGL